jgi:Holliday junction resolvase RusA-like endonuclease
MNRLHFFVSGIAKTSGSKTAFINKKTGKPIITSANKGQKSWQQAVKWEAMRIFERQIPWDGPIFLSMTFVRFRPKGHYGTGRNANAVKESKKDAKPTSKPDLLKLGRAVEDAMSGIVYLDDSQIVQETLEKRYGDKPGVDIIIEKITGE